MKQKFVIAFGLCCWSFLLVSQTLKDDLLRVNKNYMSASRYSLTLSYNMFLDGILDKPLQAKQMKLSKDKDKFNIIESGSFELIETSKAQLTIDHKNKLVAYMDYEAHNMDSVTYDEPADQALGFMDKNFDSLSIGITKINRKNVTPDIVMYDIRYSSGEFTQLIIFINTKENLYTGMTAYYREKRVFDKGDTKLHSVIMRVDYKDYSKQPVFNADQFSINKIIKPGADGSFKTIGVFKDYKLMLF